MPETKNISDMEATTCEPKAAESIETHASVLTKSGSAIASVVGHIPAENLIPVICIFAPDSGWNRGVEVYHAPDEASAKALLKAMAEAEVQDRAALGTSCVVKNTDIHGKVLTVEDTSGKTGPSVFYLGTTFMAVSLPYDKNAVPEDLKGLVMPRAMAGKPDETPFENDDSDLTLALAKDYSVAAGLFGDPGLMPAMAMMTEEERRAQIALRVDGLNESEKAALRSALNLSAAKAPDTMVDNGDAVAENQSA